MLIISGSWRKGIDWEFHTGNIENKKHIIAAAALVFNNDHTKILLTHNIKRQQ